MPNKLIDIDEALSWFELDKTTVNEENIKASFRTLAKKYHPDTRRNYKEKLASSENFIMATKAKEMLLDALERGTIPVVLAIPPTNQDDQEETQFKEINDFDLRQYQRKKRKIENPPTRKTFADTLTGRQKYDFHNPRPIERLMEKKFIGDIFSFVFCIGAMIGMVTGFLAIAPFILIYPLIKKHINEQKTWDILSGIPMFLIYYAATFIGCMAFSNGSIAAFWGMLSLVWFCISVMVVDEIYSLIRYKLISKQIRHVLSIIKDY